MQAFGARASIRPGIPGLPVFRFPHAPKYHTDAVPRRSRDLSSLRGRTAISITRLSWRTSRGCWVAMTSIAAFVLCVWFEPLLGRDRLFAKQMTGEDFASGLPH